ncbi:hypothetical protein DSD19_04705 [Rhodovulum sp. BSW8]|uniref:hypothetical protein n=1 Tax=Rhodovulum sp. BSW8 TaxID=2259645 RepID=UPI000DE4D04B|nr:hypothetical protein [Rhodovulum sp. BSW8]RBO54680.1 hypothetical protein DSD19_04705 [Rhodovulum sp. BSW8]
MALNTEQRAALHRTLHNALTAAPRHLLVRWLAVNLSDHLTAEELGVLSGHLHMAAHTKARQEAA